MADDQDGASARRARAEARRGKAVLRWARADQTEEPIFGEEAVSLAVALTRAAWALCGPSRAPSGRASLPYVFIPRQFDAEGS